MLRIVKANIVILCAIALLCSNYLKLLVSASAPAVKTLYNTEFFNKDKTAKVLEKFPGSSGPRCTKRIAAEIKECLFSPVKRMKFPDKEKAKEFREKLRNYSLNRLGELSALSDYDYSLVMGLMYHYFNSVELTLLQLLEKYEHIPTPWDYDQAVFLKKLEAERLREELQKLKDLKEKSVPIVTTNVSTELPKNLSDELKHNFIVTNVYTPLIIAFSLQIFLLNSIWSIIPYNYRMLIILFNSFLTIHAQMSYVLKKKFFKVANTQQYVYKYEDPVTAGRLTLVFSLIFFIFALGFNSSFLVIPRLGGISISANSIFHYVPNQFINEIGFNWIWPKWYMNTDFAKFFQLLHC